MLHHDGQNTSPLSLLMGSMHCSKCASRYQVQGGCWPACQSAVLITALTLGVLLVALQLQLHTGCGSVCLGCWAVASVTLGTLHGALQLQLQGSCSSICLGHAALVKGCC